MYYKRTNVTHIIKLIKRLEKEEKVITEWEVEINNQLYI